MDNNIFDISFTSDNTEYKGWVHPSDKLNDEGNPISFHVVLNDVSFAYLTFNQCKWVANEDRPKNLVSKVGTEIEKHYRL